MKNKHVLLFLPLLLTSCSRGEIRYGVKEPFITLEKADKGVLRDENPSSILEKMENKDSFVLFVHSSNCTHCISSINTFLNPYLEEHNVVVYGIEYFSNVVDSQQVDLYRQITSEFYNYVGFPYFAVYFEGAFIAGEQDSSYFPLLFETYFITD